MIEACYCRGTLILTDRGEVAVEALKVGDVVITAAGEHRPIRWLGHRDTDCTRHPEPRKVWPVRIRAGALGPGLPIADLWVSPGHALCLQAGDGAEVLVPVRHLVQGEAIAQVASDRVTYWHVELDTHDVLLANGVPAESYLDTGNRRAFDNAPGAVDLHPDFEATTGFPAGFCRPLVVSGPVLSAVRARLFGAAPVAAPEPVYMVADGIVLPAIFTGEALVAIVPAGTRDLRLMSPCARPSGPDVRTLGVVVHRITIESGGATRVVALDDAGLYAGFHEVETSGGDPWRWTNGCAHLGPCLWTGIKGAFLLRIGGWFAPAHGKDTRREVA